MTAPGAPRRGEVGLDRPCVHEPPSRRGQGTGENIRSITALGQRRLRTGPAPRRGGGPGWIADMDAFQDCTMVVSSLSEASWGQAIRVEENRFIWDVRWVVEVRGTAESGDAIPRR